MASRYHFPTGGRPSLGETLGNALGTGLGKGLTALAESKLDNMLKRQKHGQLSAQFQKMNIPAGQADYLAQQDPETQWQAVRQWWMANGYDGGDLPESIDQQWESQPSPLQELGNVEQPAQAGPQQGPLAAINALGEQQVQAPIAPQPQQVKEAPIPKMAPQRKARDLGEAFRIAEETTPKAKKETKANDQATKRAEALKDNADEMILTLDQLEALNETKKVASGFKGRLPTEWQNDETQQFDSIANELAGMYARVGGQASAYRIKFSQSMKPNLAQTYETRKKLIQHGREKANLLKQKAQERLLGVGQENMPKQTAGEFVNELPTTGNTVGDKAFNDETSESLTWNGTDWV